MPRHRIDYQPGYLDHPIREYVVSAKRGRERARDYSRIWSNGPVTFYRWDGKRFRKTVYFDGENR